MTDQVTALVADDSSIIRTLYKAWLEQLGVNVVAEAEDGRVAVDKAIELEPDLILLDVMMPEMNGYLALQEMTGRMQEPFIVMLTSVDDKEVKDGSFLEGAQDYIIKTMEPDDIKARLKNHVEFLARQKT